MLHQYIEVLDPERMFVQTRSRSVFWWLPVYLYNHCHWLAIVSITSLPHYCSTTFQQWSSALSFIALAVTFKLNVKIVLSSGTLKDIRFVFEFMFDLIRGWFFLFSWPWGSTFLILLQHPFVVGPICQGHSSTLISQLQRCNSIRYRCLNQGQWL